MEMRARPVGTKAKSAVPEVVTRSGDGGSGRRIWASLAICWGHNVQAFNKEKFPYPEGAYYASQLWRSQTHHLVRMVLVLGFGVTRDSLRHDGRLT